MWLVTKINATDIHVLAIRKRVRTLLKYIRKMKRGIRIFELVVLLFLFFGVFFLNTLGDLIIYVFES